MPDTHWFAAAEDGVDPVRVPYRTVYTGATIPAIGLGAFASDRYSGEQVAIEAIDENCRLIKGHVFLWKEARAWEDLWDPSGEISAP